MIVTIHPSIAEGVMDAPPSKSMAHRLMICAGLAEGESIVEHVDLSQDILATVDCLRALGAKIERIVGDQDDEKSGKQDDEKSGNQVDEKSGKQDDEKSDNQLEEKEKYSVSLKITGCNPSQARLGALLPCRECGSTLRFFIPLCLLGGGPKKLTGSPRLMARPLSVYEKICQDQDLFYEKKDQEINLSGKLAAGTYELAGNISSQFISGLLFALPLLDQDSRIRLIPPVESRPYIEMTIQALKEFGIEVSWEDSLTILVPGGQTYKPCRTRVEGDYSNAAFFEALNLAGGHVILEGLEEESLQGDKIYRKYFRELDKEGDRKPGLEPQEVEFKETELGGPESANSIKKTKEIDISNCPDLGPVLIAAAAMKQGARFTGTRRLKIKESDRGQAMKEELARLGIDLQVEEDEILVPGARKLLECEDTQELITFDGHNDHRIVMALSVLLTLRGGRIQGAEAVNKSLPDFFTRLERLGIGVSNELDK